MRVRCRVECKRLGGVSLRFGIGRFGNAFYGYLPKFDAFVCGHRSMPFQDLRTKSFEPLCDVVCCLRWICSRYRVLPEQRSGNTLYVGFQWTRIHAAEIKNGGYEIDLSKDRLMMLASETP
jgi:hypothetical protein